MLSMIKRLFGLFEELDSLRKSNESLRAQIETYSSKLMHFQKELNRHTVIHADVHCREQSQIIVIGRYKNRDYVRVFGLEEPDLVAMIEKLTAMEKHARVGRFDMPSTGMNISMVYDRERFDNDAL